MLICAPNLRDIADITVGEGMPIRSGKVFRSEVIHAPDAGDLACMAALGVGTVLDLRSPAECVQAPGF